MRKRQLKKLKKKHKKWLSELFPYSSTYTMPSEMVKMPTLDELDKICEPIIKLREQARAYKRDVLGFYWCPPGEYMTKVLDDFTKSLEFKKPEKLDLRLWQFNPFTISPSIKNN